MDCPHCGYFIDVEERDGKLRCKYCGSLLSYNTSHGMLTVIKERNSTPQQHRSDSKLIILECPGCKANLEFDKDNLMAFCPYCGKKLIYNFDGISYVLSEKEKTKRASLSAIEKTKRFEAQKNAEIELEKIKTKKDKWEWIVLLILISMMFIPLFGSKISNYFNNENKLIRNFEKSEQEIRNFMESNNYDDAMKELDSIIINDTLSKENKKIWQDKKEQYIGLIQNQKREYDLSDPDNILSPISSKKVTGKTKDEAKSIFKQAGFSNISTVMIEGGGGWFKKKNQVEHVVFGDKTDFTTDDYINKNDKITIYYYSK